MNSKKPSHYRGDVNISAFIKSYITGAQASLHKQRKIDERDRNITRRRRRNPGSKFSRFTCRPVRINKRHLRLPEFTEDVLISGVDRDTDLAIQLLAQDKYYKPHHFQAWEHHLTEPVRDPSTLPHDPMTRAIELQRKLEHTALYTSNVAPRTVELPKGYTKVRTRNNQYVHVNSSDHRTEKGSENEFGKCTSCTVQGFECSGHRPICSQCFYSKSEFTASFGAKDKSMCSYPVEPKEMDRTRWEIWERKGRLLFDRNMAAGVDFLLRPDKEEKKEGMLSQPNNLDLDTQDTHSEGHPEGARRTNSTSTWIEHRFFNNHDASEDIKMPSLTRLKRKVRIDDGEDLLEIVAAGGSDQAQPMVLGLQPQAIEALHQDRLHEKFLDYRVPNLRTMHPVTTMTAHALECWGTELDSSEKKGQVIEADIDGAYLRRVIGHSGFDRTLRSEWLKKRKQERRDEKKIEWKLARHRERVEAWEAEKELVKQSLPHEEYLKLAERCRTSMRALQKHEQRLAGVEGKRRRSKRILKVPKFKKRMEKTFRPWVPDKHETVERSYCDLPETTFLRSLHQYASYYYTHAHPCPDVFESMDLTAQIALGMIMQETISDFAYTLGKSQATLEASDDDRDSERTESDVSENEDFLTGYAVKDEQEADEDVNLRGEEMTEEEDTSDDGREYDRDLDDEDEDDGYMSL